MNNVNVYALHQMQNNVYIYYKFNLKTKMMTYEIE